MWSDEENRTDTFLKTSQENTSNDVVRWGEPHWYFPKNQSRELHLIQVNYIITIDY